MKTLKIPYVAAIKTPYWKCSSPKGYFEDPKLAKNPTKNDYTNINQYQILN